MAVYKFSLNDEYSKILEDNAKKEGISVQDYIRNKLFDLKTIYTPAEAVRRAKEKYKKGDRFTVPEIYGDDWNMQRGAAGVFGKQFYNYVEEDNPGTIKYVEMVNYGRHAQYEML